VDYEMPDVDGLGVVRAVVRDELPTRVLLLSAHTDSAVVFQALQEGAAGYLAKDARRGEIVEAVLDVAHGRTVVPPELAAGLAGEIRLRAQTVGPALSERERQALAAFARGLSIPQVAAELFIGVSTVKTHPAAVREAGRLGPGGRGRDRDAQGPAGVEIRRSGNRARKPAPSPVRAVRGWAGQEPIWLLPWARRFARAVCVAAFIVPVTGPSW
jgi:CheY-like chemotaxis protein